MITHKYLFIYLFLRKAIQRDRFRLLLVSFESHKLSGYFITWNWYWIAKDIDCWPRHCSNLKVTATEILDHLLSVSHDGITKLAVLSTRKGAQVIVILILCKSKFDMILCNKVVVYASLIKLLEYQLWKKLHYHKIVTYAPSVECSVWLLWSPFSKIENR